MKEKNKGMNKMLKGSMLLTTSSFIVKLLSAVYKVPFQNLTGDEGFYVYQQVYPLYGLAVVFTLTALPLFVTKIVSEATSEIELERSLQELHTYFAIIGLSFFLLFQFGARFLAGHMGDLQLTSVIQSLSYFYLFLPFLALARGYFQGQMKMSLPVFPKWWSNLYVLEYYWQSPFTFPNPLGPFMRWEQRPISPCGSRLFCRSSFIVFYNKARAKFGNTKNIEV